MEGGDRFGTGQDVGELSPPGDLGEPWGIEPSDSDTVNCDRLRLNLERWSEGSEVDGSTPSLTNTSSERAKLVAS